VCEVQVGEADELLGGRPRFHVVGRRLWQGLSQVQLYAEIKALLEHWRPRYTIIDATGLGAGLAAFLAGLRLGQVTRFVFNTRSKSKLG
jgi:hypothetical protein